MNFKTFLLLLILTFTFSFAQNNIKITHNYGSTNKEVQALFDFEKIYLEQLNFEGTELKGKLYTIRLKEFTEGQLNSNSILFEGAGQGSDHFKIKSNKESLQFLFKMTEGKLKTAVICPGGRSAKFHFNLNDDPENYALKNFFGSKTELDMDITKETPILAIITPTKHADGFSSYCEVVQSDIKPENLGTHFKIPHYFLVTIEFK